MIRTTKDFSAWMNDTNSFTNRYLSFNETAMTLKCGHTKLYGLAQSGKIPAIKFGNRWLFDSTEIDKYLKKRTNIVKIL